MKFKGMGFGAVVVSIIAACTAQPSVSELCEETSKAYVVARDNGDVDAYGDLFTEDAVFLIGGNQQKGRKAIKAAMAARAGSQFTRHIVTSPFVVESTDGKLTGSSYVTVYASSRKDSGQPLDSPTPWAIGQYLDEYVVADGRCLFKRRILGRSPRAARWIRRSGRAHRWRIRRLILVPSRSDFALR